MAGVQDHLGALAQRQAVHQGGAPVRYIGVVEGRLEELVLQDELLVGVEGRVNLSQEVGHEKLEDKERYQTIYSKYKGSVAAPTAGLHFTEELLKKIREKGVKTVYLTLHVGLGTFRPVKEDNIEDHIMHTEIYNVPEETIDVIKKAKKSGNRIFAVGTTSVRTLESLSHSDTGFKAGYGDTNIFIYPGFEFKIVDVLITNFHLPKSTLLMLVSAFSDRGKVLNAYEEAKKNDYRFFSFGDAMLLI